MKLAMKDLEAETENRLTKMHDYKGFAVEPVPGGFIIVMYGRKYTLYVAGPGGWKFTENCREARTFHDSKTCHNLIDEVVNDWQGWVQSFGGKKSIVNLNIPQQQKLRENAEIIRQQQQQGIVM